MENFRYSKEDIKDRLIRSALDFWNIRKAENLDPFVRLLIEALAMQLHLVSDDIADIEIRTMKRLSEVLLPESYSLARPAHALVHLNPLKTSLSVDSFSEFWVTNGGRNDEKFIFSPVGNFPLRRASVKLLVVEGNVYALLPDLNKKLLFRGDTLPESVGKVYVGIDFEGDSFPLQALSLFVDFPNVDGRASHLNHLSSCECRLDGKLLSVRRGVAFPKEALSEGKEESFRPNIIGDIHAWAESAYKANFVTLNDEIQLGRNSMKVVPEALASLQLPTIFKSPLLWLEISFPSSIPSFALNDLHVLLNVVPMVNKELRSVTNAVRKNFGVIPLPLSSKEYFLDMQDLEDESGSVYKESGAINEKSEVCSYSLRKGGCESFDKRDVKDYFLRLRRLLENELALFSQNISRRLGDRSSIEHMLSEINKVEKQFAVGSDMLRYLFVDSPQDNYLFYARYWTTRGDHANGIRVGTKLKPHESLYGDLGQAQLVTSTVGGKGVPSEPEQINRFKYLLGCRDRIVTNADIENFCFSELSDILSDVYIEKGIHAGISWGEGLLRTIDVHLVLKEEKVDANRKDSLSDHLLAGLESRSPMTFNYRIFVD